MKSSAEIGKLVKSIREGKKITQTEFASRLGVHKSTLSKYEKGLRNIPMDDIGKMASALDVRVEDLLLQSTDTPVVPFRTIPVLSKISAGLPLYAEEQIEEHTTIAGKFVKASKEYFGLIVTGDSMNRHFNEGDIVIVEKDAQIENGQIAVVGLNGHNATLKRVKYSNQSVILVPESTNTEHEIQVYTEQDEVHFYGKVVGMTRTF